MKVYWCGGGSNSSELGKFSLKNGIKKKNRDVVNKIKIFNLIFKRTNINGSLIYLTKGQGGID